MPEASHTARRWDVFRVRHYVRARLADTTGHRVVFSGAFVETIKV
jgi:RPA family protein